MGDMENSGLNDNPNKTPETFELSVIDVNEIKKQAEAIRVSLKDKYLGRLPGQKRGEANNAYAGSISALTGVLGISLLGFLGYVHYQIG